jgi:hypothetical protein
MGSGSMRVFVTEAAALWQADRCRAGLVAKNEFTWMDRIDRIKQLKISNLKFQICMPFILSILSIHVNYFLAARFAFFRAGRLELGLRDQQVGNYSVDGSDEAGEETARRG